MSYGMRTLNIDVVKYFVKRGYLEAIDQDENRPIHFAVKYNSFSIVKYLIRCGCNVDVTNRSDETPLYLSIYMNNVSITAILITSRCDVNLKTKMGITPIQLATFNGNMFIVCSLILAGCDVNATGRYGAYALYLACLRNHYSIVDLLIKSNSLIDVEDYEGTRPILLAACYNYLKVLNLLIATGADLNKGNKNGTVPLHVATKKNHISIVKSLIKAGCQINLEEINGNQAIHYAVNYDHIEVLRMLISAGADLNKPNKNGYYPIHIAAFTNHISAVKLLIKAKCQLHIQDKDGYYPIHIAAINNQISIAKLLIKANCQVDIQNRIGSSPLHCATVHNNVCIANCLIETKCQIDLQDKNGMTPLYLSVYYDYMEMLNLLISAGSDVNKCDNNQFSPLHVAVSDNNVKAVQYLIEAKCNVDLQSRNGDTALNYAHSLEVAELLIDAKCNINMKNFVGVSPILKAVETDNMEILKLLISAGCDVNTESMGGGTPIYYAATFNRVEMTDILIKAKCNVEGNFVTRPIHMATINCHLEVLDLLLDAGCDVNALDSDGSTPIHNCVKENSIEGVKKLINAGCNVDITNKNGNRPIHLANMCGFQEIIKLLIFSGCKCDDIDENDTWIIDIYGINPEDVTHWPSTYFNWCSTWGNFKLLLAIYLDRNAEDFDLIDINKDTIIEDKDKIRHYSQVFYIFRNINYKFHDYSPTEVFTCTNTVTNETFYVKQMEVIFMLEDIIELKKAKLANCIEITDIVSDGVNIFIIWPHIDWTPINQYIMEHDTIVHRKFITSHILFALKEMHNKEIYLNLLPYYGYITEDNQCLFIPSNCISCGVMDSIQLASLRVALINWCSEKSYKRMNNLKSAEEFFNTSLIRQDVTVNFQCPEKTDICKPSSFIVTYFSSPLSIKMLKDSIISTFPGITREDIFIVIFNNTISIHYKDEDSIEMNNSISATFYEIRQNDKIEIEYYPSSNMFKGIKNSNKIGEGAFGQVYKYESEFYQDPVAIKYFRAFLCGMHSAKILPILKEVSILLELDHPNIVKFKEFNRVNYEDLMIVMEYLDGGSLNNYIKIKGRLPDGELKYFLKQILQGLHYLHSCRIMHLDIKCDNILINGDYTVCKLADFGISRKLKEGMAFATESVTSTRNFISPELLAGTSRQYDTKTDIWSLGGAIVEMATGKMPFDGVIPILVTEKIYKNKAMEYCNEGVSEVIQKLISMCTRPVAQERPSAEELLNYYL